VTRAALVKVQIARKELQLPDDDYRSILERLTGHRSAADCSDAELGRVLDEFKAKGWTAKVVAGGRKAGKPETRKARPAADHPAAKKARALWLSLWNLGEIHDPSEAALEAFARRQLKVERLQWADQALTYKLIEALKAMAERAGWSQDVSGWSRGTDLVKVLKIALIRAQLLRLDQVLLLAPSMRWDHADLDRAISDLGVEIRAAIEAAG
jgi:phage gp16-like protein